MKFLVPNYSCLQNPWLGGHRPQIPVLSVLCPQLNLLKPPPPEKIPGFANGWDIYSHEWKRTKNGRMEQPKAMEYGSRKSSPDILKPHTHTHTYIYIYIYISDVQFTWLRFAFSNNSSELYYVILGSILSTCPYQISCYRVISSNIVSGASILFFSSTSIFIRFSF